MLIFLKHKLAFLATPKTGTTAVESALRRHAEIIFTKDRKHLPALRFKMRVAPFLRQSYGVRAESVAVMRDPLTQIRSWYRYRNSRRLKGSVLSTQGKSFDDFVRAVIAKDQPPFAQIGSQFSFLTSDHGDVLVDHLFAYENQPAFLDFMAERLSSEIELKAKNISPEIEAPLSPELEAALRAARADEFALYDRVQQAGGYLHTPSTK